jgi:imidazole glycerol phosphate synthase subunit HisF
LKAERVIHRRLTATVLVRDGSVVSSYNFSKWLPVGDLAQTLVRLDQMFVDDIVILNQTTARRETDTISIANMISLLSIQTPLAIGGGIKSVSDALAIASCGIERLVFGNWQRVGLSLVREVMQTLGAQSAILSCPFFSENGELWCELESPLHDVFEMVSQQLDGGSELPEMLLMDKDHEGQPDHFNLEAVELLVRQKHCWSAILYGGVGNQVLNRVNQYPNVSALAFGNPMHASELCPQRIKESWPKVFRSPTDYYA